MVFKREDELAGNSRADEHDSKVSYALGDYEKAVRSRLAAWIESKTADRIWSRDFTVWSSTHVPEITDRLGWLALPESMRPETDEISQFADGVKSGGFRHAVLLGMGGSSLAAEVYQATFGNRPGFPELMVLDSTHPDAVSALLEAIDPESTLFIVASKSGTTIESLSLFEYFYGLFEAAGDPGAHFAAITDPGTPLEELSVERGFRRVFKAFPDIGGRYSALSHFGLVPAALVGMDTTGFLNRAAEVAARCRRSGSEQSNPGLMLGAVLAEVAIAGRDKVTFLTSPSLAAFPNWLEQLIAESTGKQGRGIVPIVGEPRARPETYGGDRFFVYISLEGEADSDSEALLDALVDAGHPAARFDLSENLEMAGEMFRWEFAIASAGAALGINPFNQPDVQSAKSLARQAMSEGPGGSPSSPDSISSENAKELVASLSAFLNRVRPGDYLAITAFITSSPGVVEMLQEIRSRLLNRYSTATTLGFGPRYLHSTGQLHKGGPDTGVFLQLVDEPREDLEVPRKGFTFARLVAAQAVGDYNALFRADRRVIRIDLGPDAERGLGAILEGLPGM